MMQDQILFRDSIYALASGRLPAGVAVIRLSGPHVAMALSSLVGGVPPSRELRLASIRDEKGEILDRGLVAYFPGPKSFTGEDVAELHLHGGKAVVAAVLAAIGRLEGFRHAEAGEFSRRAFLLGKMALTDVEALSDLIASETEAQRRFASLNSCGSHAQLYAGWRKRIIEARAMVEAELDFADEADIPGAVSDRVWADVGALAAEIESHVASYHRAEILRDGFRVVLLGAPNSGKSSLLNALAGRDVAIVTDEPGTTRDLVEVQLDVDGMKVVVTDTAGIRETAGRVEAIGIERAVSAASAADLVLYLEDLSAPVTATASLPQDITLLTVGTKADLTVAPAATYDLKVSAHSGEGIDQLIGVLRDRAANAAGAVGDLIPFRQRHVDLLSECTAALQRARQSAEDPLELRAEELRAAAHAVGRIAGEIDVEDLLDTVFSTFCIGK